MRRPSGPYKSFPSRRGGWINQPPVDTSQPHPQHATNQPHLKYLCLKKTQYLIKKTGRDFNYL